MGECKMAKKERENIDNTKAYDLLFERKCTYLGVEYKIIESLKSNMLLVVPFEDFVKGTFPLPILTIPSI